MGLTFAKSVRFGPVRFNFSTGGIGVSAGIPGLRIGTGPRGAYVAGGIGGFRYRKSLDITPKRAGRGMPQPGSLRAGSPNDMTTMPSGQNNVASTIDHDAMDVLRLEGSSSDELLRSMNEQSAKISLWPFALGLVLFALMLLSNSGKGAGGSTWQGPAMLALILLGFPLIGYVAWRDRMRKLTVLFFEPDILTQNAFEELDAGARVAMKSSRTNSVAQTAVYRDSRYSAGAGRGLKFESASIAIGQAPGVRANVDVPLLKTKSTTLAFFPDRVLVFKGKSVGGVTYDRLKFTSKPVSYIENDGLASDAKVIGRTWQYVNQNGSPDRRFKNNRELPICEFNECSLTTPDGLDVHFFASRPGAFDAMAKASIEMRAR